MGDRTDELLEAMRSRVLRGLQSGTLRSGDRLPSARALERELEVDHRILLDVYRTLATEGLVETRPRGGVYVATRESDGGVPPLPEAWFADILAEGIAREIPVTDLHEWLRRCTETLRLRAAVIATTADQAAGLCRELLEDFGIEAEPATPAELSTRPITTALRRADLLVTTEAQRRPVEAFAAETRKHAIVIEVRADLIGGEWRLLLQRPIYAVVATEAFAGILQGFVAKVPGSENLRTLVLGRDDLGSIPPDAPTYITQQARAQLGDSPLPGRLIPAARTIALSSAREITRYIVHVNRDAMTKSQD